MARWSSRPADKVAVGRGRLRKLLPSGIWHFHHKNQHGEWTSRSTGHRDKRGAVQWAEAFSVQLTQTDFGVPAAKKPAGTELIETALAEWLDYQRGQNAAYTHRSYCSIVRKFNEFVAGQSGIRRLRDVSVDTAFAFRRWARERGNSKVTVDNNLIALRSAYNYLTSRRKVAENPFAQRKHGARLFFDQASPRRDTFTNDEYHRIVKAAKPTDAPVFIMLANLGLRASELAMLECTDIDEHANTVSVRRKTTHDGIEFVPKDKADRTVPINDEVRRTLGSLGTVPAQSAYVVPLPSVKSRRDYFERSFLGRLKKLAEITGIPGPKLTLHNFRRFFVSQCADSGIAMATVMDWLGHDEMKMVMHYYRLRDESAQSAMRQFRIPPGAPDSSTTTDGGTRGVCGAQSPPADAGPGDRRVRLNRTASHHGEHLGNKYGKTAFPL